MDGSDDEPRIGRRRILAGATAVVGGSVLGGSGLMSCASEGRSAAPTTAADTEDRPMNERSARMPVAYVPHGGGPWPFVEAPMGDPAELSRLASYLRGVADIAPSKPRALLVVSAHWEEPAPTVMTAAHPPMLYDYGGFPPEAYQVRWPAPGDPPLASRVRALLDDAGIGSAEDPRRGFDHGTFVPLKLTYPEADVPTVQLSLVRGLDPDAHLSIGRALAPLRDEGVFVVGSGMSFHDMRAFAANLRGGRVGAAESASFDDWLRETVTAEPAARDARLARWRDAPHARACHPREEHLLPLMVVAGAAGDDRGSVPYSDTLMGVRVSAAHFG